jgi:glycosyltransferase involved in cell wall biosynthesis
VKLITIITASFNDAAGLNALAGYLRRENKNLFDWIVIDGGSSDNTADVAEAHNDLIDTFVSEPDYGVYDAWNKGIAQAKGQWILFLGCDDQLGSGWLDEIAKAPTDYDLIYGDLQLVSPDHMKYRLKRFLDWDQAKNQLPRRMCFPQSGMAHSNRLFKNNVFDHSYRICGDWEFLIRAKPQHGKHVDRVQAIMTLGGLSSSSVTERRMYQEILRVQKKTGQPISLVWRLKFYVRILLSYCPECYKFVQKIGMKPWSRIA